MALLNGVNAAGDALSVDDASKASEARRILLLEAKKLVASLEDPHAEVWPRAFQVNVAVSAFHPRLDLFCVLYPLPFP